MITYLVAGLIFGLTGGIIFRGIDKSVTGQGNSGWGCGCSGCSSSASFPEEKNQ